MSITRFTSVLAALVTALGLAPSLRAELFKPFEFPAVETDFQFFAPADVETFGGGPKHKTGWFATFDRVYINVQRPLDAYNLSDKMGDFTWGNRFDLGYVDDDGKGWLFTGWHIDGPNENNVLLQERLNRFVTGSPQTTPIDPFRDNNLRLTGDRDYLVTNSINVMDLSGIELNRTWLKKQLMHGAWIEPFGGFRYVKILDFYRRDAYERFLFPGGPTPLGDSELLSSFNAAWQNDMVGGQLGIRWYKDYRRWNFSGDVKAFAFQNFQNYNQKTTTETTYYGATPDLIDTTPISVIYEESDEFATHDTEFVLGFEVRAEAAYRLTRDVSLRVGFTCMDFAQGIARGADIRKNDQDVFMYGLTFGATLNR
jgi:hypothetical protein